MVSHSLLWKTVLWFLAGVLLLCLCAPMFAHAEGSGLQMYVSPKATEVHQAGDEYVVWAAIKTPAPHDRITFEMTLDPRVELVTGKGAAPTYNGPDGSGGHCGYKDDSNTVLSCYASADNTGWVGVTAYLRFTGNPVTYTGRELTHDITLRYGAEELTDTVVLYIPPGTLGTVTAQVYLPLWRH